MAEKITISLQVAKARKLPSKVRKVNRPNASTKPERPGSHSSAQSHASEIKQLTPVYPYEKNT